jgi:gliding motility-associated lipoprotein GldD
MHTPNGLTGIFFKVGGNAATAKQFFLSDTTKNFIRGALYFDVTPNADSLKPVQDFLQTDIEHMINTFKWITPVSGKEKLPASGYNSTTAEAVIKN